MASVYILYSQDLNKHYIGSCLDVNERIKQHLKKSLKNAFTAKANDWKLVFQLNNLEYQQARSIEKHIKNIKSSQYLLNLILYSEISKKLIEKYS